MDLIIGQGIAGTTLALQLYKSGTSFRIIDNGFSSSSSMVAAGLWNPIVFRRVHKSWMANELISYLESFYPEMEIMLGAKFYHPLPIYRVHGNKLERDLWDEKKTLTNFKSFLGFDTDALKAQINHSPKHGSSLVHHTGYIDVQTYLLAAKSLFAKEGLLITSDAVLPEILGDIPYEIAGQTYTRIIDCRGHKSAYSPYWHYLPWGLTKGEVLTIRSKELKIENVFNAGFFLFPITKDVYKLGATFDWKFSNEKPSNTAFEELNHKFRAYFNQDYKLLNHEAGVRPTVQDRRPLIGKHAKNAHLYLFNGLGTKGIMLAPYLSKILINHLHEGDDIPSEMNISRFSHLLK